MPLRLYPRPNGVYHIRGTVQGRRYDQSARTRVKAEAEAIRAKLEADGLLVFRLSRRGAGFGVPGLAAGRWGKLPLQDFLVFNQELLALPTEQNQGMF